MFLLFPSAELHFLLTLPNLHSNMFLLFPIKLANDVTSSEFTFQYVSIISGTRRSKKNIVKKIYIPICFYYFPICQIALSTSSSIYIPICFYYFKLATCSKTSPGCIYIPICFYYFCTAFSGLNFHNIIYIPICFYYFPAPVF